MEAQNKLRMTKQRQVILEELRKVKTHPTADDMYQILRKRMPKISLGTVYRNLEILSDTGIIQKLDVGGTQKRFDGDISIHSHVRCVVCGKVGDIDIAPGYDIEGEAQKMTDFQIIRHRLEFTGFCPACRQKKGKIA
ncbi:MAG: transcriptional repressor [Desulfobulbaceae bacterium DB1]|nr:MAG: transcriptional repressor [Desulfobulbaceae bacterium DB1]